MIRLKVDGGNLHLMPLRHNHYSSKWLLLPDMESLTLDELLSTVNDEDKAAWKHLQLGYTKTFRPQRRNCKRIRSAQRVA